MSTLRLIASSHSETAASSSGTLSKNAPRLACACTPGNVERPLLSTVARSPWRSSARAGAAATSPAKSAGESRWPSTTIASPALELREQVVAALAGAAAAHDAAGDLVAQVLAERGLRIEAGIDQQHARERLVVRDGERGGRGVAKGEQVAAGRPGSGARARARPRRRSSQSASNVTSSGSPALSPVPRGSISSAPWPRAASARTSCTSARREPTASLASGETTSSASAASSGPSAYVNTGASGSPANAAVGITAKLWVVPGLRQALDSPSDGEDPPHPPTPSRRRRRPRYRVRCTRATAASSQHARAGACARPAGLLLALGARSCGRARLGRADGRRARCRADVARDVRLAALRDVAPGRSRRASSWSSAAAPCASSRTASSSPTPFIDVSSEIGLGGERGLLSIAFAPDYAISGLVYADATLTTGTIVVWEFHAAPGADVGRRRATASC